MMGLDMELGEGVYEMMDGLGETRFGWCF